MGHESLFSADRKNGRKRGSRNFRRHSRKSLGPPANQTESKSHLKERKQLNWNNQFRSLISRVKASEGAALFCHQNADPDATCSAFALQILLKKLVPEVTTKIVCPEGVSASTKQLLDNLGIIVPNAELPQKFDLAILVDTNTIEQLGAAGQVVQSSGVGIVVIDHHHPHPDTEKIASQMLIDESAAAAAEVIYRLFHAAKLELEIVEAKALLAAIYVETKHFLLAREATFTVAAGLVKSGADPRHLSDLLSSSFSRSERVARLKAAGRSQVTLMGSWIIVTSELGSYQSSGARGLLGLGAHVAFVAGGHSDKSRVNMRATEGFYEKTGVHLGRDVAIPLGKKLAGTGGGHATAAGLSVPIDSQNILSLCLNSLKDALGPLQT